MAGLKKKLLLSFCCGALATLGLPPFGFIGAALALAVPFYFAITAKQRLASALLFGMGGFGWFAASLYWIGAAFLVKGGLVLFLLPFACLGLPLLLACFWAFAAGLACQLSENPISRIILLALFWGCVEWGRSVLLTGFPWNVIGHVFIEILPLAQMSAFIGQHGLNFLMAAIIAGLVAIFHRSFWSATGLIAPVLLLCVLGSIRIFQAPEIPQSTATIRLIQPAIDQAEKWNPKYKASHIKKMIALAHQQRNKAELTLLPEAAIAGFWRDDQDILTELATAITPEDGVLLAGILSSEAQSRFYNSAFFMHHSGGLLGRYNKQHLVPFGEYVPFRNLPFIDALAGQGEFSPGGPAEDIFIEPFGYIRVLICYEIIFPDFIAADKTRPDMIITISNDAWFGQSLGPYQHFAQSRLRAIEEGVPVYRLANTGISGAYDGYGRLIAKTRLGAEMVLDIPHYKALSPSFYSQNRHLAFISMLLWLSAMAIFLEFAYKKRDK